MGQYTDLYLTAVDAEGILTPMMTVVLISVIKDGVEDVKRHRADNVINRKKVLFWLILAIFVVFSFIYIVFVR